MTIGTSVELVTLGKKGSGKYEIGGFVKWAKLWSGGAAASPFF